MTLFEIQKVLDAEVLCGNDLLYKHVFSCFACDLISEMLLYVTHNTLVITSLTNIHIIHTTQVMDAVGIVFVGGKRPDPAVIMSSEMSNIPLLTTNHLIYECCGRLFANGLKGDKKTSDCANVCG